MTAPPPARPSLRIAYLLSQYPAVNHVFMLREIRSLRRAGFEIHAASLSAPDRPLSAMTAAEQEETRSTFYVKTCGASLFLRAHVRNLFGNPAAYCRGLRCALRGRVSSPARLLHALAYFAEAIVVGEWMRRRGLRHLHSHFSSTVAMIVARSFPVTMSAAFHGPAEFQDPSGFRLAEKVHASLFSCAISRFGQSQLMYWTPYSEWPRLEVTPLGIDPGEFLPRRCAPPGDAPRPFRILCVGRLAPVKGQHVLIAAAHRLLQSGYDLRLSFAGDGPERAALERDVQARGIAGHVVFAGNLNQEQLRALYAESDAMVLPSFGEGLPVVLMEAMAMQIPCVSTWVAGVPELIRDGVNGLLAMPGDVQGLAACVEQLIREPELRLRLAARGRETVLDQFNLERNVERLAAVFLKWLAGAPIPDRNP